MGWWIGGAAVVVVLLVVADRVVARGWFDHEKPRPAELNTTGGGGGGMFGDLVEIFQPNHKHVTAEQERQRLDIHYAGDDAPPFDPESGTVTLRREKPQGEPRDEPRDEPQGEPRSAPRRSTPRGGTPD